MNEAPKFRGWEPELKGYYYFDLYTVYCAGYNPHQKHDIKAPMTCFNINHRPFEAYTEVVDRDDAELYDGDIVLLLRSLGYQSNKGDIGVIQKDDSELGYNILNEINGYPLSKLTSSRAKHIKKIGTYRENPELLKKE